MHRSVLHSKSFQRYFLTYAAIFAAMIFISILLLARTTNMERARAAEQQRSLQAEKISIECLKLVLEVLANASAKAIYIPGY